MDCKLASRQSEYAAVALKNGLCRLIELSWNKGTVEEDFDYFHAAFETDGSWNSEFHDSQGRSIWIFGNEESVDFDWRCYASNNELSNSDLALARGVEISVRDVEFESIPKGCLCQTVEERGDGIPRHWKKWRIV